MDQDLIKYLQPKPTLFQIPKSQMPGAVKQIIKFEDFNNVIQEIHVPIEQKEVLIEALGEIEVISICEM